jgi:hypothetical protein
LAQVDALLQVNAALALLGLSLFSQSQGNVNVQMGKRWAFRFDANQQGIGDQRENQDNGLRFNREGDYTLSVCWRQALKCKSFTDGPVSVMYLNLGDQRQADLAVGNKHVLLPIAPSGSGARSTVQGADPVPACVDGWNRRRVAPAGAAPWGAGVGTTARSCGWRGS